VYALYRQTSPTGRSESIWRRWLDRGEVYVAERDGVPVAFVHVEPGAQWISHVGVAEAERGLGVGGYLFSRAIDDFWAENPGAELGLAVVPYDTPAMRLYRRLGFAPWLVLEPFELALEGRISSGPGGRASGRSLLGASDVELVGDRLSQAFPPPAVS
jgi:GNAT superfamily N-acetyltransferase